MQLGVWKRHRFLECQFVDKKKEPAELKEQRRNDGKKKRLGRGLVLKRKFLLPRNRLFPNKERKKQKAVSGGRKKRKQGWQRLECGRA